MKTFNLHSLVLNHNVREDRSMATLHLLRNRKFIFYLAVALLLASPAFLYQPANSSTTATDLNDPALIALGRKIFFNETFGGNGRTCGTCHRAESNFSIDPSFIATLPANDALFVAEFTPALKKNFEKPKLMRKFGLILENTNGFGDLANNFTMRGVPHTLALRTSIDSANGPRTGWSGDGAPDDGSLRSFAIGAVIQHFTKTLNRVAGVDFRLPTARELDALAAFQLSLGPMPVASAITATLTPASKILSIDRKHKSVYQSR